MTPTNMLLRLARHMETRRAVLLQGVIWWAWHLPLLVIPQIHASLGDTKGTEIEFVIAH